LHWAFPIPLDEEQAARQFEYMLERMLAAGYVHYEISNFALPGCFARHNSNYWLGQHYLGIGPSAHSFNGQSRQWNIANNTQYIKKIKTEEAFFEKEVLSPAQQYNEYVMTSLRTIWGCEEEKLKNFGADFQIHFTKKIQPFLQNETVEKMEGKYVLSTRGKLLADRISMELFYEE